MRYYTDPITKRQIYWFTVSGTGLFPIDMLRFDLAWPASSDDAERIVGGDFGYGVGEDSVPRDRRSIRLGCANRGGPTIGRWSSFGWTVGDADRGEVG